MKDVLISIIVPVYNVEKYLGECIDSIINQTYKNLEIILVDDGSTDNSGKICDDYAIIDKRVSVIHKKNGGLSDARNIGIEFARGYYLYFADSDDYISENAIEVLFNTAEKYNADIVKANVYIIDNLGNPIESDGDSNSTKGVAIYNKNEAIDRFIDKTWSAWNKLYKSSIHKNVLFPVGKIHEDEAIMCDLLQKVNKVVEIDDKLYYYRRRKGSITESDYSIKKMDWFYAWKKNTEFINENYPLYLKKTLNKFLDVSFYNLDNLLKRSKKEEAKDINNIITEIRKYKKDIILNNNIKYTKKLRVLLIILNKFEIYKWLYIKKKQGNI